MDVSVLHAREKDRSHRRLVISLAGDSFIERARSTTFALLGLVAALGLLMIALALRQEWPLLGGSPLPSGGAPASGSVHIAKAVALTEAGPAPAQIVSGVVLRRAPGADTAGGRSNTGGGTQHAQLESNDAVVRGEPAPAAPPSSPPASQPVSEPVAGQPATTPAVSAPQAAPEKPSSPTRPVAVNTAADPAGHAGGPGKSATRGRGAEQRSSAASPQAQGPPSFAASSPGPPPGRGPSAAPGQTGSAGSGGGHGPSGHGPSGERGGSAG
jgi:hypothetical protein